MRSPATSGLERALLCRTCSVPVRYVAFINCKDTLGYMVFLLVPLNEFIYAPSLYIVKHIFGIALQRSPSFSVSIHHS